MQFAAGSPRYFRESGLCLLSWNVHLLSITAGSPTQLVRRAACIAARILAADPPLDVVCLQEVWDVPAKAALLDGYGEFLLFQMQVCAVQYRIFWEMKQVSSTTMYSHSRSVELVNMQ